MRRRLFITILTFGALLFASCEQEPVSNTPAGYYPIFRGYMQFSTEVSTRAQLATDMKDKSFGVLGYQYSPTSNWASAKVLAKPDLFYDLEVKCEPNGLCSYDIDKDQADNQLKPWEDYLYSFFAYHPYGGDGITISAKEATNTPTLTYKYGWLSQAEIGETISSYPEDYTKIFDLMTAEAIDLDGSGNVNFNFKHRLFAVEVLVNNFNENTEGTLDARHTISDLKLKVKGLANQSITLPLSTIALGAEEKIITDGKKVSYTLDGEEKDEVTFLIQGKPVVVPAFNEELTQNGITSGRGIATSISKLGSATGNGYLMFIPQTADLSFTLTWTDDKIQASDFAKIKNTLDSTMEFKAGKLYQIIINYVGSGITIAIIEAGSWDNQNVYYTFE